MRMTIEVPDELARQLEPERDRLAEIIRLGLNEHAWLEHEVENCALAEEMVSFFARNPSAADIVAFRPSGASVARGRALLAKNRDNSLTLEEGHELESMARLNRFFMELKARMRRQLASAS
ncbi:MAG: hypothetical protein HZA90_12060 [Verrucomicrobia bacterium]|nr:hypothetical protein [Verrucomicrobiota bacterium]